jgi:hypothetical protein
MSLQILANDRAEYFTAVGGETVFPYNFPLLASDDLAVWRRRGTLITRLALGTDYTVADVGNQAGGTVTLTAPAIAGDVITLAGDLLPRRITAFTTSGDFRADALNAELNRLTINLQELTRRQDRTVRLADGDPTAEVVLPDATTRAGKAFFFDLAGNPSVGDLPTGELPATLLQDGAGATARAFDLLVRRAWLDPYQFGLDPAGTGAANLTALNAAIAQANASQRRIEFRHACGQTVDIAGQPSRILSSFDGYGTTLRETSGLNAAFLRFGPTAGVRIQRAIWRDVRARRQTQSAWTGLANCVGIEMSNADNCDIEVAQAEGFTIGLDSVGDGLGFEDNKRTRLGLLQFNQIGLRIRSLNVGGWNIANHWYGGQFSNSATLNPSLPRYGVAFFADPVATGVNSHLFDAPNFELGKPAGAEAYAFWFPPGGNAVLRVQARDMRGEGNSPSPILMDSNCQDIDLELVSWNPGGPDLVATRGAGNTFGVPILRSKTYAVALDTTREVATVPNVRAVAYREDGAGNIGFDGLVPIATTSAASTLLADSPGGLSGFTLNARSVTIGANRGLGFIVDTNDAKLFLLLWELLDGADSGGRLFVRCFDASLNVLDDAGGDLVFGDRGVLTYAGASRWWAQGSDASDSSLSRRQVVRLADAVKFAQIGVFRGSADVEIMSIGLETPDGRRVPVLHGLPTLNFAGSRESFASVTYDPPNLADGAGVTTTVTVPRARPGDEAFASFDASVGGILVGPYVQGTDTVAVRWQNETGGALDIASSTLRAGVRKARL